MEENKIYRCDKHQIKLLNKVKEKVLVCYSLGMLPKELSIRIYNLSTTIDKEYFDFLQQSTEDFMRLRGYYHKKDNMERGNKSFLETLNTFMGKREVKNE